jgi:transposase
VLTVARAVRVFVATRPTDMRRSFDGLAALAREVVRQDPLAGHLFLFRNRTGDRVKILWWDRGGFVIYYRRLEEGTFQLPESSDESLEIDATALAMILEGVDLAAERLPRFVPPAECVASAVPGRA